MTIIDQAMSLAMRAHEGQTRKGSGIPYIMHPAAVAVWATQLGMSEVEIAAAWLHDVVEDCPDHVDDLMAFPHEGVVSLVKELTNASHKANLPRGARKQMDREKLDKASFSAKRLKMIDRILNLREMGEGHTKDFMSLYARESRLLLAVLRDADSELARLMEIEIDKLESAATTTFK